MATSPSAQINEQVKAAIAAGDDPLGDNDPPEVEEQEAEAETDPPTEEVDPAAAGADADPTAEASTTAQDPESNTDQDPEADAEAEPVIYKTSGVDFKAEIKKVEDAMEAVDAKWEAGELTDAERRSKMAEFRAQERELIRQQSADETLEQMNRQNVQTQQLNVLQGIAKASKEAGQLDYSDPKIGNAYDAMLRAVHADPENEGKTFKQLATLAHQALCAARGVKVAAAAEAKPNTEAKPAAVRSSPQAPTTLRGIPNAATSNTGGDKLDALGRLSGQSYQAAFNSLSAAEKKRLVDGE